MSPKGSMKPHQHIWLWFSWPLLPPCSVLESSLRADPHLELAQRGEGLDFTQK